MSVSGDVSSSQVGGSRWERNAPGAKRDLIIKKIAITLIALINLAALGLALYYVITYCPVPAQAILISPFIVGVLAALSYLKFPTLGVSSFNYTSYLNPLSLAGRVLAYVFFGPLMYAVNKIDWTPYHDPIRANKISKDLAELPFEKIAEEYGSNFDNLTKYGFIDKKYKSKMGELYKAYKPIKSELEFWRNEGLEACSESVKASSQKQKLNRKWQALKKKFEHPFPHPTKPSYDFSKRWTRIELKARSLCCFGPPIDVVRRLET